MKPIQLKMQAFGAYVEPVTLDFERGLGDEKIFLIHGDTGAGKTTILDAICYALYGETSGKARDGKMMRSLSAADNVATEVEFTFKLGEKIFTAYREINYNPNRKEKFQSKQELAYDGKILTKDREIKSKITELIGFNSDQFRQVVMLPQGKFAEFLSANADERQAVLNVLFDSEPYKKIEDTLREKFKTSADEAEKLKTRQETLSEQTKGANLDEITAQLSKAQTKVNELKNIFDAAQKNLSDGKTLSDKFKNLRELTKTLTEAKRFLFDAGEQLKTAQAEYQLREGEESRRKELDRTVQELKIFSKTLADLKKRESTLEIEREKLAAATKTFDACEAKIKPYEARLIQRKAEREKLAGADVDFERAKQLLKRARELENLQRNISQLEKTLTMEREKLAIVEEKFKSAQIELNRLQIVHSAAHLATKLVDGEPCPVCGSREHPKIIAEAIPTVAELNTAQENLDRCDKDRYRHKQTVAGTEAKLSTQKNRLPEFDGVPDVPTAEKICADAQEKSDALKTCQANIDKGEKFIEDNKTALKYAEQEKNSAANAVAKLEGEISGLRQQIPENYLTNREKLNADLHAAQNELTTLENAWKSAQKNFNDATKNHSECDATFKTVQKNFDALNAELKGKTLPDIDELYRAANISDENLTAARDERAKLETQLDTLKNFSAELDEVTKKLDAQQKIADMWRRLSDVANATGKGESELKISFQRYFLSTMFNDVVIEANNRLRKMSDGRYAFQMKDAGKTKAQSAGLNLEILDEYTGKTRAVETLSGGESFLASLSLALGLAAVVRNKVGGIQLDTIFIDEGFGSLDNDALNFAISTITEQSGGRLVGIISHVESLKDNLPVRLEVTKIKNGSTAKFISR